MKTLCALLILMTLFSNQAFALLTSRLSFSSGSMQKRDAPSNSFSELDLGLRYRFDETFSLQASYLARFVENDERYSGAQLILPISLELGDSRYSLESYLAPGYRFISGYQAPLVEGGIGIKLNIFRIGVGYRSIFNGLVKNGLEDESQLFIFTTLGVL